MISIYSSSTKITHFCFSSLNRRTGQNSYPFLINCKINDQTFCEFIYSSATGCIDEKYDIEKRCLFMFSSFTNCKGSFRFQCINATNSIDYSILNYYEIHCLTMQMNTLSLLKSMNFFHFYQIKSSNNCNNDCSNYFFIWKGQMNIK